VSGEEPAFDADASRRVRGLEFHPVAGAGIRLLASHDRDALRELARGVPAALRPHLVADPGTDDVGGIDLERAKLQGLRVGDTRRAEKGRENR
jgi:hypothetical protein